MDLYDSRTQLIWYFKGLYETKTSCTLYVCYIWQHFVAAKLASLNALLVIKKLKITFAICREYSWSNLQRYSRINFVVSVLPAPDSPEMTKLWLTQFDWRFLYAASAKAKTWGSKAPIFCPWYLNTVPWKFKMISRVRVFWNRKDALRITSSGNIANAKGMNKEMKLVNNFVTFLCQLSICCKSVTETHIIISMFLPLTNPGLGSCTMTCKCK